LDPPSEGRNVSDESVPQKVLKGKDLAEASAGAPTSGNGDGSPRDKKVDMKVSIKADNDGRGKRGGRSRKPLQKMVIDSDDESAGDMGSEYEMSEEEESEEDLEMDDVTSSDSGEEESGDSKKSTKKQIAKNVHAETPNVAVNTKVQITPSSFTTPGSMSKRLREVLDSSTPGSGTELGVESPGLLQSASRFLQRESSRFPFLQADKIRDAQRRRPGDPEYVCYMFLSRYIKFYKKFG